MSSNRLSILGDAPADSATLYLKGRKGGKEEGREEERNKRKKEGRNAGRKNGRNK
jgi:hypothetical protein